MGKYCHSDAQALLIGDRCSTPILKHRPSLPGKRQAAITVQEAFANLSVALRRAEVLELETSQWFVDTALTRGC
jgi:hypothetical protein